MQTGDSLKLSLIQWFNNAIENDHDSMKILLCETPHLLNWLCSYKQGFASILHRSAHWGATDIVCMLLESGKGKEWIDVTENDGLTAFAVAITQSRFEVALKMLHYGTTTNFVTKNGQNVYHLLALNTPSNIAQAKYVLSLFNRVIPTCKMNVNDKDAQGNTPLKICIDTKNAFLAKYLCNSGASFVGYEKQLDALFATMDEDDLLFFMRAQSLSPEPPEQPQKGKTLKEHMLSLFFSSKDEKEHIEQLEQEEPLVVEKQDNKSEQGRISMLFDSVSSSFNRLMRSPEEDLIEEINAVVYRPYIQYRQSTIHKKLRPPEGRKLRILCMDGGGVRCIMHCVLLKRITELYPDFLDSVDMVCGTSGASALAMLIALGVEAENLPTLLCLSAGSLLREKSSSGITSPKYTNKWAKVLVDELFGDLKIREMKKYFAIPAFCLDNSSQIPERRKWDCVVMNNIDSKYDHVLVKDAVLRSCSAPSFFEQYQGYTDGGVFANNPSVCAIPLVCGSQPSLGKHFEDVVLLSLGTGEKPTPYFDRKTYEKAGLMQWLPNTFTLFQEAQDEWTSLSSKMFLGNNTFRLHPRLPEEIKLDEMNNIPILTQIAEEINTTSMLEWIRGVWYGDSATPTSSPSSSCGFPSSKSGANSPILERSTNGERRKPQKK